MAVELGPTLSVETRGELGWIVLRNESGVHVLTEGFPDAMQGAVSALEASPDVRAVIVTGKTRVFCAGADLNLAERLREPEFGRCWLDSHNAALVALSELPKPTVAAVNGAAYGAGFNLALACDFIVASLEASFCQAFIRIGLATDMGSLHLLPQRVGVHRARELMYTGRSLSAQEALDLGVVDEAVEAGRLAVRAQDLAAQLAAGPPRAFAAIKRGMAEAPELGLRDALQLERELQLEVLQTDDFQEGAAAFLEGREPRYRGT
jgi:2-(1,2-epoxy-1,2-dihydrophenyl)acetyl-CoA isomerase